MIKLDEEHNPAAAKQSGCNTSIAPGTPLGPNTPQQSSSCTSVNAPKAQAMIPEVSTVLEAGQGKRRRRAVPVPPDRLPSRQASISSLPESDCGTLSETASDSQSDGTSECSASEWTNFDITPLVKEELKQAIVTRRKTQGLPNVEVDFSPRPGGQLTPEEEEKRVLQKERNRMAAAKCRTKKRDAVGRLMEEAQLLEMANDRLREEMTTLEAEREKLRFLLDMHSPDCLGQTVSNAMISPDVALPKQSCPTTKQKSPIATTTVNTLAEMTSVMMTTQLLSPNMESASSFGSYLPPTPSTTCSQSSAGSVTPTLLTPTSGLDEPQFTAALPVTKSSSTLLSPDSPTTPGSIVPPDMPSMFQPAAPLTTVENRSVDGDFINLGETRISSMHEHVLPPAIPPTSQCESDIDLISLSFVEQYLGDDTFDAGEISLLGTPNSPAVLDDFASILTANMGPIAQSQDIAKSYRGDIQRDAMETFSPHLSSNDQSDFVLDQSGRHQHDHDATLEQHFPPALPTSSSASSTCGRKPLSHSAGSILTQGFQRPTISADDLSSAISFSTSLDFCLEIDHVFDGVPDSET